MDIRAAARYCACSRHRRGYVTLKKENAPQTRNRISHDGKAVIKETFGEQALHVLHRNMLW